MAVLAMYLLVLLAPLHQAAALQHSLAQLGYQTSLAWSICAPLAEQQHRGDAPTAVKCPLAGAGKPDLIANLPSAVAVPGGQTFIQISDLATRLNIDSGFDAHQRQPRAPPVTV